MSEETRQVLQMLSEGKVSVEEAERLLAALRAAGGGGPDEDADEEGGRGKIPKYLRVVVDEEDKKVNVRIPVQLIRAGMKFTSLIPESARADVEKHLSAQGIDFDFRKIRPEDIDGLLRHLRELTVDVDEGGRKTVRVFCE